MRKKKSVWIFWIILTFVLFIGSIFFIYKGLTNPNSVFLTMMKDIGGWVLSGLITGIVVAVIVRKFNKGAKKVF